MYPHRGELKALSKWEHLLSHVIETNIHSYVQLTIPGRLRNADGSMVGKKRPR